MTIARTKKWCGVSVLVAISAAIEPIDIPII